MKHPIITLSPDQLAQVYEHGHERDAARDHSRNYGIEREQTHIRGLKGELAVADYYDLKPDLTFRAGGDDGTDFVVEYNGDHITIDVKTTGYTKDPWLRVRADGHHAADYYLLAAVDGVAVKLAGWASAETVHSTKVTNETGHHDNHILPADECAPVPGAGELTDRPPLTTDGGEFTDEEIAKIKSDSVLELSDFGIDEHQTEANQ